MAPITDAKLQAIADEACEKTLSSATQYDHALTKSWNETIINHILTALVAESKAYKYIVNSVLIQHTAPLPAAPSTQEPAEDGDAGAAAAGTQDIKPSNARRGMHSAQGAFWNQEKDGMWSTKYDAEGKGLDAVITVVWVAV